MSVVNAGVRPHASVWIARYLVDSDFALGQQIYRSTAQPAASPLRRRVRVSLKQPGPSSTPTASPATTATTARPGLALDQLSAEDVSRNTNSWEKVVHKLVARQMPPQDEARPSGGSTMPSSPCSQARSTVPPPKNRSPAALRRSAGSPDRVPVRHSRPAGDRYRRHHHASQR